MKLQMLKPRLEVSKEGRVPQTPTWGRGRGGRPWRRKRDAVLLRDAYTCQHCGYIGTDVEVDHIVNVASGGSDDESNLQTLCVPCHKVKTAQESAGRAG